MAIYKTVHKHCFLFFCILIGSSINCSAAWVEIFPRNTCHVHVNASQDLPQSYLTGYSLSGKFKVTQYFGSWSLAGSIYNDVLPDVESICQYQSPQVPDSSAPTCVIPRNGIKCEHKEFWATYSEFEYGGSNAVGTYWNGSFAGQGPVNYIQTYIQTWEWTCQSEYDALVNQCGGENNIIEWSKKTCTGRCGENEPYNFGPPAGFSLPSTPDQPTCGD